MTSLCFYTRQCYTLLTIVTKCSSLFEEHLLLFLLFFLHSFFLHFLSFLPSSLPPSFISFILPVFFNCPPYFSLTPFLFLFVYVHAIRDKIHESMNATLYY